MFDKTKAENDQTAVPSDGGTVEDNSHPDQSIWGESSLHQTRGAPGSLHEDGAAGAGLDAELVVAVVHDGLVAQGAGGQVEPPGERLGAGAVVAEPAGLMAAGGGRGEDPGAGAAGVLAGPGQGQADREVRVRGRGAGGPGGGGDGGFQRPGEFAQRL